MTLWKSRLPLWYSKGISSNTAFLTLDMSGKRTTKRNLQIAVNTLNYDAILTDSRPFDTATLFFTLAYISPVKINRDTSSSLVRKGGFQ